MANTLFTLITIWEDYLWSHPAFCGVLLILVGDYLALKRPNPRPEQMPLPS